MSWSRLDDLWTEQMEHTMPDDFADRWHYLAMIQRCSRVEARDGIIPTTVAERASDHPNPREAITRLASLGLVVHLGKQVKLVHADQHVISEERKRETERKRDDQRRSRAHREGSHQYCIPGDGDKPKDCSQALSPDGDVTGDKSPGVPSDYREESVGHGDSHLTITGDVGTGRDGPGQSEVTKDLEDSVDLETGEIDSTPSSAPADHVAAPDKKVEPATSAYPFPEPHPILDAPAEDEDAWKEMFA